MSPNGQPHGLGERLLDLGSGLALIVVPAVGAWLIRYTQAARRRREQLAKLEMAGAEALRTLDEVRQYLHARAWQGDGAEAVVLRHDVDEARELLWTATGHESKRQPLTEDDVVRIIKQTSPDARKRQDQSQ